MKVFVDTNVLVSAFATRGLCADVVREVLAEHEFMTCEHVLGELERTLRVKFHVPDDRIRETVDLFRRFHVEAAPQGASVSVKVRDVDDVPVLGAALAAGADLLVTGDDDLLCLNPCGRLRIVNPREFWNMLRSKRTV